MPLGISLIRVPPVHEPPQDSGPAVSGFFHGRRLVTPSKFRNEIGTCLPIAPCGEPHCRLYANPPPFPRHPQGSGTNAGSGIAPGSGR